jgi:hypothetical protein
MAMRSSPVTGGPGGFLSWIGGELPDSPARAEWRRSRPFCLVVVAAAFFVVNWRSLSWGWLALDDWKFIVTNPNLGHGWHSLSWALTDVQFGRRWTPVLWLVACTCGVPTAFKFHVLVFVLGLILSLLVTEIYGQGLRHGWALPAALLFTLSPLRIEVFTWGMGFVYETVAILLCMAWLVRRKVGWSGMFVVLALATYPQAAGAALAYCWVHRKRLAGWAVAGFLLLLIAIQYRLRIEYGVVPWHHRFDYLPIILPHYALNLFVPFATVPLFPSLFYPLLYVGAALIVVVAILRPYPVFCWILLFAPTLVASVTEAFWLGTRYCLIPSIAAYGWLIYEASKLKSKVILFALWIVALAFGVLNLRDVGMSRGVGLCANVASQEAALVGIDFDLVRTMRDQAPKAAVPGADAPAH